MVVHQRGKEGTFRPRQHGGQPLRLVRQVRMSPDGRGRYAESQRDEVKEAALGGNAARTPRSGKARIGVSLEEQ